jgi:hypothetical protein
MKVFISKIENIFLEQGFLVKQNLRFFKLKMVKYI